MYTLFIVLIVLASLLMIFIVLIQESKGGGLASNFSSSNSIMGVRKTTVFIEKATWGMLPTRRASVLLRLPLRVHRASRLPLLRHRVVSRVLLQLPQHRLNKDIEVFTSFLPPYGGGSGRGR